MRHTTTALALALVMLLSGCGGGTFIFTSGPEGSSFIVVSGTCSSVQTVQIVANGGFILVTSITLLSNGISNTLNFCGDVTGQFPVNSFLTVKYTNGPSCATPTSVVVGNR